MKTSKSANCKRGILGKLIFSCDQVATNKEAQSPELEKQLKRQSHTQKTASMRRKTQRSTRFKPQTRKARGMSCAERVWSCSVVLSSWVHHGAPIPHEQHANAFNPQTKKATSYAKRIGGKSQLSKKQKSHQKNLNQKTTKTQANRKKLFMSNRLKWVRTVLL